MSYSSYTLIMFHITMFPSSELPLGYVQLPVILKQYEAEFKAVI